MDKTAIAEALLKILQDGEKEEPNQEEKEAAARKAQEEEAIAKAREEAKAEARAELEAQAKAEAEKAKAGAEKKGEAKAEVEEPKAKKEPKDSEERKRARELAEKEVNLSLRDSLHQNDLESEHLESISGFISYDRLIKESGEVDADAVKSLADSLTSIALRTPPKSKRSVDDLRSNKTGLAKYLSE